MQSLSRRFSLVLIPLLAFTTVSSAFAFTPNSPQVKKLCDKAMQYLHTPQSKKDPQMGHFGGPTLVGYAMLKYDKRYKLGRAKQDPLVLRALKMVLEVARSSRKLKEADNYNLGMAIIFLIEFDFENDLPQYEEDISKMLAEFKTRQRRDGSWSYNLASQKTGDTSQTQYAVLSLFTARRFGFDVSDDQLAKVCNWLLRTQDPTGSWGYQGQDPGIGNFGRIDQSENEFGGAAEKDNHNKAHSDAAAGLGSLYIAANMLKFTRQLGQKVIRNKDKKRGSLTAVKQKRDGAPTTKLVNGGMLLARMNDGDNWFGRNYSIPSARWQYYYLYTYERYQTFKELREGREKEETAPWYDDGVNFLASRQRDDGAWRDSKGGPSIDSALAVLFLVRSTKIVIGESVDSLFAGGRGLPDDTTNARMEGAKVFAPEVTSAIDEFRSILATVDNIDPDKIAAVNDNLKLTKAQKERKLLALKVKSLLSATDPAKRRLAVKSLTRTPHPMDHVPTLIFALSDPDDRIIREARNALRFVSRRFGGMGLPDELPNPRLVKDAKKKQEVVEKRAGMIKVAQEKWRKWYRSVNPEAGDFGFGF